MRINPWLVLLALIAVVWLVNAGSSFGGSRMVSYDTFVTWIKDGKVKQVVMTENRVDIQLQTQEQTTTIGGQEVTSSSFTATLPPVEARDAELMPSLIKAGVKIVPQNPSQWLPLLSAFLPVVID